MDGFIGEIRAFTFGYAPRSWIECNGQTLSVMQYQALYSIVGNIYGGNPQQSNFQLPDLRGQAAIGAGQGPGTDYWRQGTARGTEVIALRSTQIAPHDHALNIDFIPPTAGTSNLTATPIASSSKLSRPAKVVDDTHMHAVHAYTEGAQFNTALHPSTIGINGGSTPHENRQPYLTLMYCICWDGEYPIRP